MPLTSKSSTDFFTLFRCKWPIMCQITLSPRTGIAAGASCIWRRKGGFFSTGSTLLAVSNHAVVRA